MKTETIIFMAVALIIHSVVSVSLLQTSESRLESLRVEKDTELRAMKEEVSIASQSVSLLSSMWTERNEHVYKYRSPIESSSLLTSPVGYRELLNPYTGGTRSSEHRGIDLVGTWHCLIRPIALNGVVVDKWYVDPGHPTHGGYVRIKHPDGWIETHSHLSKIYVKEGDRLIDGKFYRNDKPLPSGGSIGRQGNTGQSEGEHEHLGLLNARGEFVNPLLYVEVK